MKQTTPTTDVKMKQQKTNQDETTTQKKCQDDTEKC